MANHGLDHSLCWGDASFLLSFLDYIHIYKYNTSQAQSQEVIYLMQTNTIYIV